MSFRDQLKARREACGLTRAALAGQLGVSASAVGNYETGVGIPKGDNNNNHNGGFDLSGAERTLLEKYRSLSPIGRSTVRSVTDALCDYRDELTEERGSKREPRLIPLYNSPAAAGYAAPVLDEDFTYIPADESVPRGADFAVRIQGDSMEPYIHDESVVYVNRDPLADGDVGSFCVDGAMLCKQYHRDALGMTYLFSLNRARADADVVLTSTGTRSLACFGRVMLPHRLAVPQL